MDQRNIEKARRLFKERGAIRREYIRDEIAYSWVRSRLHTKKSTKIIDEKYGISLRNKVFSAEEFIGFIYANLPKEFENYLIMLCGYDGKVKNKTNKYTKMDINIPLSFREEAIGTNGIGTGIGLKRNFTVADKEHYDEGFDGLVSGSIFDLSIDLDNCLVGFIANYDDFKFEFVDYISSMDFSKLTNFTEKKSLEVTPSFSNENEEYQSIPFCLIGNSGTKNALRNLVLNKSYSSSLINIYSKNGSGKEYLARFIHSKSSRSDLNFYKIDGNSDVDFSVDALIDEFEKGTLYVENYSGLSAKSKSKFRRKVNCKLVNSTNENDCNKKDVAFIISENIDGVSRFEELDKLTDLKLFSSGLNVFLDGVNEVKSDLIQVIKHEVTRRINVQKDDQALKLISPKVLDEKCKEIYDELSKIESLSYRFIDRNFDELVKFEKGNIFVNRLKDNRSEIKSSGNYMTLKEVEREYIEKVMKITDNNVQKCSEILGIGRTTIYRKLKE